METSYGFGPGVVRQPSPEAGKEVLATMTSQRAPGTDSRVLTCQCRKVKFGMSAGPQLSNRCIPADDLMWYLNSPCVSDKQTAPRVTSALRILCTNTTLTQTHTCLQCEPASGCCCLMGPCPPAGPPAHPPAGWGPAPGSHCTSSSAGTDGSLGVLPAARRAVPRFDAAPLASGGQHSTKACYYLKWVWCVSTRRHVVGYQCRRVTGGRSFRSTHMSKNKHTLCMHTPTHIDIKISGDCYLVEFWVAKC